ncbi:MAG: hypothetical protein ABW170_15305 [Candidatus Thiodiazotropha sp. L084R]
MPYIAPYRSQLRPYNHAYAYRGLTAFATLSMAVSDRQPVSPVAHRRHPSSTPPFF